MESTKYGPCPCGCGIQTKIAHRNRYDKGWVKGQPRPHDRRRVDPTARYIADENGCWIWTGARMSSGYGHRYIDGRWVGAHRAAWEEVSGPIPDGLTIDHLCRVRLCVNPAHLELVTHAENCRRATSPLTQADVDELRRSTESHSEVGARLGISKYTVRSIRYGKSWADSYDPSRRLSWSM